MTERPKTIVLVDDHPAVCEALAALLKTEPNLQVASQAYDGATALAQIKEHHPELVILDLKLPDIDGLNLITRARQQGSRAKILVFSMLDPRAYVNRIIQAGGNGFIGKDRPLVEVLATVLQIMHGYNCFPNLDQEHLYDPTSDPLARLTQRELVIMLALARGTSNKELANRLHLSDKTISSHKAHILDKLNLSNLAEMIDFAHSRNLLE